jgi:disulfide bond formation protein DsbB
MSLGHLRFLFLLAFTACASILGAAIYLQQAFFLEPCVLCLLQRLIMLVCAILCLCVAVHGPGLVGARWYSALLVLATLSGGTAAGTQVWLQTASMDVLVPLMAVIERILYTLQMFHEIDPLRAKMLMCAEVNWSLFGFSIPEWSLLAFCAVGLFALWALCRGWRQFPTAED